MMDGHKVFISNSQTGEKRMGSQHWEGECWKEQHGDWGPDRWGGLREDWWCGSWLWARGECSRTHEKGELKAHWGDAVVGVHWTSSVTQILSTDCLYSENCPLNLYHPLHWFIHLVSDTSQQSLPCLWYHHWSGGSRSQENVAFQPSCYATLAVHLFGSPEWLKAGTRKTPPYIH